MASTFEELIEQRRREALAHIDRVPVAVLIWGPAVTSGSPVAASRGRLRAQLNARGHLARFSEELIDPALPHSLLSQQVAQADAYDIVFAIPDSPAAIAEIYEFARLPGLARKVVAFLDQSWDSGHDHEGARRLAAEVACSIQTYSARNLPSSIVGPALELVRRQQEFHYVSGRRY